MATDLMTAEQAASRLQCRRRHVYKLVHERQLRAINISPGSKRPTFRFDPSDLDAFLIRQSEGQQAKNKSRKRTRDAGEVVAYV